MPEPKSLAEIFEEILTDFTAFSAKIDEMKTDK